MTLPKINVGCGATPTPGWLNFDNSLTIRIATLSGAARLLSAVGILNPARYKFAQIARERGIRWADATRRIPVGDGSASVVYTSHMFEHLTPLQAERFLHEVKRVLVSGGILRLAIPDLAKLAADYIRSGDADAFVAGTLLAQDASDTLRARLRYVVVGARYHAWMYDASSLCRRLARAGFLSPTTLPAGQTMISDPGGLDLQERQGESVYVEALRG
jgi:predicted SAM-dependent methyltransferase